MTAHGRCVAPHGSGATLPVHCKCPQGPDCEEWPGGTGADRAANYLRNDSGAQAALVAQEGSADDLVATLQAAGWTLSDTFEYIDGKRIRYMVPPTKET